MYRDSLPHDCGMLFVFEEKALLSFWMKDTKIPLSIAFINELGEIVDIKNMEPYSLESVRSKDYAIYALEVNKGWFKNHNINVGDKVDF